MIRERRKQEWLQKLNTYILQHFTQEGFTVSKIAFALNISERQLYRNVKEYLACTPRTHQPTTPPDCLCLSPKGSYNTVAEVAHAVGYKDAGYFSKKFKERFGISPLEV